MLNLIIYSRYLLARFLFLQILGCLQGFYTYWRGFYLYKYWGASKDFILTGEVFIFTNIGVPPRIVAPIRDTLIFADPHQAVRTVVELWIPGGTLPIPVTILDISDHPGLGQTGVILQDLIIVLSQGCRTTSGINILLNHKYMSQGSSQFKVLVYGRIVSCIYSILFYHAACGTNI